MSEVFYSLLTQVGLTKQAAADAGGDQLQLSTMVVGDSGGAYYGPDGTETELVNQVHSGALTDLRVDPTDPTRLIAELVIPADVGGWWVREVGIKDAAGDLLIIAKVTATEKPLLASGSGKDLLIQIVIAVSNVANVVLQIDPSVVYASRGYVDNAVLVTQTAAAEAISNHNVDSDAHEDIRTRISGSRQYFFGQL